MDPTMSTAVIIAGTPHVMRQRSNVKIKTVLMMGNFEIMPRNCGKFIRKVIFNIVCTL